jgi:hypothetical protein
MVKGASACLVLRAREETMDARRLRPCVRIGRCMGAIHAAGDRRKGKRALCYGWDDVLQCSM